jgi:RNA polymerase sigma factor (sigma-70 family)
MPILHIDHGKHWIMASDINSLYSQILTGDPDATEQMFCILGVSFRMFVRHRVMNGQDGEEVVQDALTTIAEKYRSVQIESSFAGWAYRVLNNKLLDYYKSKRVRSIAAASPEEMKTECPGISEDPALKTRLLECLRKIHGANSFHARALNLHYQGYGTTEICKRLGITPSNLYAMLSRARTMLRLCLEKGEISQ